MKRQFLTSSNYVPAGTGYYFGGKTRHFIPYNWSRSEGKTRGLLYNL